MELLILAIGIAERVIYRFIDGRERRLRLEKLEAEVAELARQRASNVDVDVRELDAAAKAEVYRLVNQIDGVRIDSEGRLRRHEALVKVDDSAPTDASRSLDQLKLAVASRRTEIEGAGRPEPVARPVTDPAEVHDEAKDPAAAQPSGWTSGARPGEPPAPSAEPREGGASSATSDPRLHELAERVRNRREGS